MPVVDPCTERAGWRPAEWAALVGITRAKFYKIPTADAPRSTTIGRARIVIESPRAWLNRVAAKGGSK